MNKEQVLEMLAGQYNVSACVFEEKCREHQPLNAIPTLELIEGGAILSDFAGYLQNEDGLYEPCEYLETNFLNDKRRIPVGYTKRGEMLEGIDNS